MLELRTIQNKKFAINCTIYNIIASPSTPPPPLSGYFGSEKQRGVSKFAGFRGDLLVCRE